MWCILNWFFMALHSIRCQLVRCDAFEPLNGGPMSVKCFNGLLKCSLITTFRTKDFIIYTLSCVLAQVHNAITKSVWTIVFLFLVSFQSNHFSFYLAWMVVFVWWFFFFLLAHKLKWKRFVECKGTKLKLKVSTK